MNAREELERIVEPFLFHACEVCGYETDECVKIGEPNFSCRYTREGAEHLAQAILSKLPELGYVRLEDVEIDKEKLASVIYSSCTTFIQQLARYDLATAIASAKPIRVKK